MRDGGLAEIDLQLMRPGMSQAMLPFHEDGKPSALLVPRQFSQDTCHTIIALLPVPAWKP